MRNIRRNQDGFTFVELVVVVAIVAIMATISVVSLSRANKMSVENGLSALQAAFDDVRYETMSRANESINCEITKNSRDVVLNVLSGSDVIKTYPIVDKKYELFLRITDETGAMQEVQNVSNLTVSFQKGDGALASISCVTEGSPLVVTTSISKIQLSFDNEKYLTISPLTGRSIVE